jgi:catechol 2,3-dioxygenase-like lactoylglutathione lyase family enzyme
VIEWLMLAGLGHVDLVCRDLAGSLAFYAAVLGPLGLQPPTLFAGERGEQIHYLRFPAVGSGSLGLRQASGPEAEQPFELYAPGLHHLALAVETEYHPAYYATFFLDPDGFRIEVAASRDARL